MSAHTNKKRVLFLCTGNSCRSQMAEGFVARDCREDEFDVASAGTKPTPINPMAVRVMAEVAIDITSQYSKSLDEVLGRQFDYVITVCDRAGQACPGFSGEAQKLRWSHEDPAQATGTEEERLNVSRRVRKEIGERIRVFVRTTRRQSPQG